MTQLRRKVDFRTNLPVHVALAYDDGILKQDGRFGDYWVYTLEDERVMFVPPAVHDQIQKLHVSRGQPFTITKSSKWTGHRRVVEWTVGVPEEGSPPVPNGTPAPLRPECLPRT